jgi:hypothetical protein
MRETSHWKFAALSIIDRAPLGCNFDFSSRQLQRI